MPFNFQQLERRSFEEPVGLLREFVSGVEGLLRNLLFDNVERFDFREALGEDRELLQVALLDLRDRDVFGRTVRMVEATPRDMLLDGGLAGPNLRAKFSVLNTLSDAVRRGVKKALKYIIDLVDAVLGSIAALAGGTGMGSIVGSIGELKDAIRAKIDLVTDWDD